MEPFVIELVLIAIAAVAVGVASHKTARPTGPVDAYTAWFLRHHKPELHR